MTVSELIKQLQSVADPDNTEVVVDDERSGYLSRLSSEEVLFVLFRTDEGKMVLSLEFDGTVPQ